MAIGFSGTIFKTPIFKTSEGGQWSLVHIIMFHTPIRYQQHEFKHDLVRNILKVHKDDEHEPQKSGSISGPLGQNRMSTLA